MSAPAEHGAPPAVLVNGRPAEAVDVLDRGFQYGDGLFETIRITRGAPEFWDRHMARLMEGCGRLGLPLPDAATLAAEAERLTADAEAAILKIIVTRGAGGRGYRPPDEPRPTRVVCRHPFPAYPESAWVEGVKVRLCATRLGGQPLLAGIKHLNRLEQVLARAEWDDPETAEGLMRDNQGFVIEGTMTNLFTVKDGALATPELIRSGVAGVMRGVVLDLADRVAIPTRIARLTLDQVAGADELLLTNSAIGIWPVRVFEGRGFAPGPVTRRLMEALAGMEKA